MVDRLAPRAKRDELLDRRPIRCPVAAGRHFACVAQTGRSARLVRLAAGAGRSVRRDRKCARRSEPSTLGPRSSCDRHRPGRYGPADTRDARLRALEDARGGGSPPRVPQSAVAVRRYQRRAELHAGHRGSDRHACGCSRRGRPPDAQAARLVAGSGNPGLLRASPILGIRASRRQAVAP